MRFMLMIKATDATERGEMPATDTFVEMGKFNEELINAGILLAGDGLQPSSKGARVYLSGDKRMVVDGPFTETKELVGGFWILQVKSKEEAVEWARRIPFADGEVELRRLFETEDFAPSDPSGQLRQAEQQLRDKASAQR